jgi:hypothetical protein
MKQKREKSSSIRDVVFYSYPKLLYCWPLIVLGPLLYVLSAGSPGDTRLELLGWIYILVAILVVVTMGLDFERNLAFFWLIVFGLFFFLGRWLEDAKGFSFFGNIYSFFNGLNVRYSPGMGMTISILLAFPYLIMLIWARLQNKWRITHNEFEHYAWGRADDSLARGAKRVRSTYPDVLELLMAGAGTLIVYSATGRTELRRINNVPMLPLLRRRIDRILESTAVTTTTDAIVDEETEAEVEEQAAGPETESGGMEDRL